MATATKFMLVLITLVAMAFNVQVSDITEDNLGDYLAGDCNSVADFVSDNLIDFTNEYNSILEEGEEPFNATYVEFRIPIRILTLATEGVYLDFDGNNGYMILADDYELVAMETSGDLPYLRELDYSYYAVNDGFMYPTEDGEYEYYEIEVIDETDEEVEYGNWAQSGTQVITDIRTYLNNTYGGSYWIHKTNNHLSNFTCFNQMDTSVYLPIVNGTANSEGNCSLNSIFTVLNFYRSRNRMPNLPAPTDMITVNPENDSFYSKYASTGNYFIAPTELPKLYNSIRNYAIKTHGYQVGGFSGNNTLSTMKSVASQYGYSIDGWDLSSLSYESRVMKDIDASYPLFMATNGGVYGSHKLTVIGYATYAKVKKVVLGVKYYDYKKTLTVADNWDTSPRYYDMEGINAKCISGYNFTKIR